VVNDLERPVFEKYPILADMKRWLSARPGVAAAGMSGSGSTMFAVISDPGGQKPVPPVELESELRMEFGETLWIETTSVQH
jgi:4-diphosphocytidyl-2-C-methyl-D-erythritol kinase